MSEHRAGLLRLQPARPFLGLMPEGPVEYSEATAGAIDREVNAIISAQYERALAILKRNRPVLETSVAVLLEKETIDGDELKALVQAVSGGDGAAAQVPAHA